MPAIAPDSTDCSHHSPVRWTRWLCWLAVVALTGCASTMRLENDVTSHTAWPSETRPVPGNAYAFERLPSQRGESSAGQDRLERLVEAALQPHGLRKTLAVPEATWVVQVQARHQQRWQDPWGGPFGSGFPGAFPYRDHVVTGDGRVIWLPVLPRPATLYHERELTVIMRHRASGDVVFESRARQEGPWSDSDAVWSALAEAALNGFPEPPQGERRVMIDKPRQ